jgi:putative DNA primase/helicase
MATIDPIGAAKRPGCKYIPRTYRELLRCDPPKETVEDVLPATGSACIYGQSGAGKTFLALDLALAIARGDRTWFGYRVAQRHVIYVCLEGEANIRDRLKAHADGSGKPIPDSLVIIDNEPFELANQDDIDHLLTLTAGHESPVVIIDTLTRATAGMDLNNSSDMGKAIAGIDRIRREGNCLVVSIYHSTSKTNGTNATELGHSSLRGSLDASLFVWADGDAKKWTTAKVKDASDGAEHQFGLKAKEVRINQWGNPKSSCYVTESHRPTYDPESEKRALCDQLENFLTSCLKSSPPEYHTGATIEAQKQRLGMSRDKIRETIAVLKAQMRLIDMPLPDGKRGGKQTYLHPAAKVPTSREDC